MRRIRKVLILRIALAADSTGGGPGRGDARWDMTTLTITPDSNVLTVVLESSSDATSPVVDGEATIAGVEFDVAHDASTGAVSGLYPKRWFGFPTPADEGTTLRGGVQPSASRK